MASSSLSLEGTSYGNKNQKWVPFDIGIMIVDEDPTSLLFVHTLLTTCHYRVVTYENPIEALYALVNRRGEFDLVIVDLHLVTIPGFNMVEHVTKGFNLPVISTCADEDPDILHQALDSGACFHLVKPMTINNMEFVWKKSWKIITKKPPPIDQPQRSLNIPYEGDDNNISIGKWFFPNVTSISDNLPTDVESTTVRNKKCRLREKDEDSDTDVRKSRLQWDCELHKRFLVAIALLGDDAVPSGIIGIMNVSGLTTRRVASHLQKHRKRLMREKQMQEKEKYSLKAPVISRKFPTSLTPSSSKKRIPTPWDIQVNQEQLLAEHRKSSGKMTPFILPKPPTTNHLQINGPLLNQHNPNFWKPPLGPSKTKPRSKVDYKRKGKLTNQQSSRRNVTKFMLPKPSTANTDYGSVDQFMNFGTNEAGPSEIHDVDNFIEIGSPLPYILDSTAENNSLQGIFDPEPMNVNPMQELVNNNEWPIFDELVGLNDEPLVLQNGLDAGLLGPSRDFAYDSEHNNYRNVSFDDDAFLDDILINIDMGGPA